MSYNIITLDSTGEHQIDLVSASYWNNEDLEVNTTLFSGNSDLKNISMMFTVVIYINPSFWY